MDTSTADTRAGVIRAVSAVSVAGEEEGEGEGEGEGEAGTEEGDDSPAVLRGFVSFLSVTLLSVTLLSSAFASVTPVLVAAGVTLGVTLGRGALTPNEA